jgi:hypothetical protein
VGFDPLRGDGVGFDDPHDAVQENGTYGGRGKPPVTSPGPAACCLNFRSNRNGFLCRLSQARWRVVRSVPLLVLFLHQREATTTPRPVVPRSGQLLRKLAYSR